MGKVKVSVDKQKYINNGNKLFINSQMKKFSTIMESEDQLSFQVQGVSG